MAQEIETLRVRVERLERALVLRLASKLHHVLKFEEGTSMPGATPSQAEEIADQRRPIRSIAGVDDGHGQRRSVLPAGLDNAPVDEIRAAIEAAEIAKREAAKREGEVLREQFLGEKPSRPRLSKRRRSSGQECTRLAGAVASDRHAAPHRRRPAAYGGSVMYAEGKEDPVAIAIREAGAELDRQRAEEERARRPPRPPISRGGRTREGRATCADSRAMRAV